MKVVPIGKKVLIKQDMAPETYGDTGIYIPESERIQECKGVVIAIGEEVEKDGFISVDDTIQYADYITPVEMEHKGETHLLINYGDVLARIVDVY